MPKNTDILFDKYNFKMVSSEMAQAFGITEAFIISILHQWICYHQDKEKNDKKPQHLINGVWSTYMTIGELQSQILFVNEKTVRTAVKHLEQLGILNISHHSYGVYRATNWYSLNYGKLDELMRARDIESVKITETQNRQNLPQQNRQKLPNLESVKFTESNNIYQTIYNKQYINSCSFQNQEHGGSKEEFFDYLVSGLNVNEIFANTVLYFIDSYSAYGYGLHPSISEKKLMELCDEFYNAIERNNICNEDWLAMIDDYFKQKFRGKCDHSIFHCFTPGVLDNLYHHVNAKAI